MNIINFKSGEIKNLIENVVLLNDLKDKLEKQSKSRQDFWNTILICIAFLVSSFSIITAFNVNKYDMSSYVEPFFICTLFPISFILINYTLYHFFYTVIDTKRTVIEAQKKNPEKYEDKYKIDETNHVKYTKFIKHCNQWFNISGIASLCFVIFIILYIFYIILELTK